VFEKLREQILTGYKLGIYPDSSVVIFDGSDLKMPGKLFDVELKESELTISFKQVEKGKTFHVGIAVKFHKQPESGQLIGTLHMHT